MVEDGTDGNNEKKSAGEVKKRAKDTELTERPKQQTRHGKHRKENQA